MSRQEQLLKDSSGITSVTEVNNLIEHFEYNPLTDKLEADRAIETTLNSLFLGELLGVYSVTLVHLV